jgi:hypothetical protein
MKASPTKEISGRVWTEPSETDGYFCYVHRNFFDATHKEHYMKKAVVNVLGGLIFDGATGVSHMVSKCLN